MESTEQTSSHPKRKLGTNDDREHFYSFDIEHDQTTKSFCCRSPTSSNNNNNNNNININRGNHNHSLANYQQTTKIIQEFNIQQSTSSDITVSSTINIKSTPKAPIKPPTSDLLSEADFQRVVQDITPADRDLFDEFLNGIKQKTDDYLFLSSFDDLPSSSNSSLLEHDSIAKRHSALSSSSQTSSTPSDDRRRNPMARGSSTIHYSPHSMPISNRPPAVAAQTLKQMAVQHQQRTIYSQQQQPPPPPPPPVSYSSFSYNNSSSSSTNPARSYYQQSQTAPDNDNSLDPNSYYQPMNYPPVQPPATSTPTTSGYNPHSQQRSNIYGIQNYSYRASSSFYQQQQQSLPPPQPICAPSHPMTTYSPSNGLPTSTPSLPFYSQDDNLPLLDL